MHPKIKERRWEVLLGHLVQIPEEDQEEALAAFVAHYEGKLPRPQNYRKKTSPRLRILLGTIDDHLELLKSPAWGPVTGAALTEMYQRHRTHVVDEMRRRKRI